MKFKSIFYTVLLTGFINCSSKYNSRTEESYRSTFSVYIDGRRFSIEEKNYFNNRKKALEEAHYYLSLEKGIGQRIRDERRDPLTTWVELDAADGDIDGLIRPAYIENFLKERKISPIDSLTIRD